MAFRKKHDEDHVLLNLKAHCGNRAGSGSLKSVQRLDQTDPFPYSRSEYIARFAWIILQSTLFRFSLPRAYRWRRMLLKMFRARIAAGAGVRRTARVVHPWLLEIGEHSIIGDHVNVYNLAMIRIGDHTVISQGTTLCGGTHDYRRGDLPLMRLPITIGNGVWIAAEAFISPDVVIGDNAVVGARAVVVKNVGPDAVVAGNPARLLRLRWQERSQTAISDDGEAVRH